MGRQLLRYTGGLIALYLVVGPGSNFGEAFSQGATGSAKVIKTLQGRG